MKYILLFAFVGLLSSSSYGVNYTANAGLGTWTTAASWAPNGVPTAGDNVVIPDGSTMRILGTAESCSSVFLNCNAFGSSTNANLILIGASSLTISGNLTMDEDFALTGLALLNIASTSTITVGGNLIMNLFQATGAKIFMSSGASTLNIGGAFTFPFGQAGTLTGGTNGSTVNFNSTTVAQTIPTTFSTIVYDNISTNNTSVGGATFDGALSTTIMQGTLSVASGALSDGGFTHVIAGHFLNAGTYNASGGLDLTGNFTNTGNFVSTGCNINLAGNWNNTGGAYTYSTGDAVILDGTGTQSLDGNTTWNNLTVNHTGTGISFASGTHNIEGLFDINSGAVTNSGANVVLVSSPSRTAQMPDIGTGSYTGNMTVERYIAKTGQTFTSLTSPVTGTTLNTWSSNAPIGSDSLIFSGFAGSDYPTFSFTNTWFYNEAIHGSVKANGWVAATGMSDGVGASNGYKGVYIYMDAVNYKLYATGTPTTGNVSIPLDYNASTGGALEDGWNLIGNPYPCTVDWNSIYADTKNKDSVINGYLAYSGDYANYAWYDGATSSGSGGATQNIPSSQGFWVRSLKGSPLIVKESMKNTTDVGFLKSTAPPNMRIFLTGNMNSFQDEALIFSDATFNDAFEDGDIGKFLTMNPDKAPTLFTKSTDGVDLAFNKVGTSSISIPLSATAGTLAQGTYSLGFAIGADFMPGACISLEDLHTGIITDLRADTSYSYTTSDTTTLPRFIIHMVKDFNTNTTALTCYGTNDGVVAINGNGIMGSTFSLLDGAGNTINTGTASNDSITFNNIAGGTYEISTNYSGSCSSNNTYAITVAEPMQVTADFSLTQDTLYLNQNDILEVTNNSLGTNFAWDFGDGNTSTFVNPTHTYVSPGVYPVMLTSNNDNVGQCSEVTTKNIVVMSTPLSIEEVLNDNSTKAYVRKGYIVVEFDLENETELEIVLIDINGKKITNTLEYISSGRIDLISTDVLANGIYIVNIIGNNQTISKKLIIE